MFVGVADLYVQRILVRPLHQRREADSGHVHGAIDRIERELRPRALCSGAAESPKLQLRAGHLPQHYLELLPPSRPLPPRRERRARADLGRRDAQPRPVDTLCEPPPKGGGVCKALFADTPRLWKRGWRTFRRSDAAAWSLGLGSVETSLVLGRIWNGAKHHFRLRADRCCITLTIISYLISSSKSLFSIHFIKIN